MVAIRNSSKVPFFVFVREYVLESHPDNKDPRIDIDETSIWRVRAMWHRSLSDRLHDKEESSLQFKRATGLAHTNVTFKIVQLGA